MTDTLLAARGVRFAWPGGAPLFQHLDIQLRRGEVLAVLGEWAWQEHAAAAAVRQPDAAIRRD